MLVIPAIDLRGGRCVRLYQGDPNRETVFGDDPLAMARHWQRLGAQLLHVVDLDGAFAGSAGNSGIIASLAASLEIPIQLGGGMRTREDVERSLEAGVSRVILGTMAVERPELARELVREYGYRLLVGIDAREGQVTVKGWKEAAPLKAVDLARQVEAWGVTGIVYTDIQRDGTLRGPNLKGLEELLEATALKIIVSGGVSSLEDLAALKPYAPRVSGVIVGQALYTGKISLPEAIQMLGRDGS